MNRPQSHSNRASSQDRAAELPVWLSIPDLNRPAAPSVRPSIELGITNAKSGVAPSTVMVEPTLGEYRPTMPGRTTPASTSQRTTPGHTAPIQTNIAPPADNPLIYLDSVATASMSSASAPPIPISPASATNAAQLAAAGASPVMNSMPITAPPTNASNTNSTNTSSTNTNATAGAMPGKATTATGAPFATANSRAMAYWNSIGQIRQLVLLIIVGAAAMGATFAFMRSGKPPVEPGERLAPLWEPPSADRPSRKKSRESQVTSEPKSRRGVATNGKAPALAPVTSPLGFHSQSDAPTETLAPTGPASFAGTSSATPSATPYPQTEWPSGGIWAEGVAQAIAAEKNAAPTTNPESRQPMYEARLPTGAPGVQLEGTITHPDLRGDHDGNGSSFH